MVCAQVIGNDLTITVAGQSGNFQLNVMLPVVALNLLETIELFSKACTALNEKVFHGFAVNREKAAEPLAKNPILVTAPNSVILRKRRSHQQGLHRIKRKSISRLYCEPGKSC